jgi:lysophospholipase L1-like esterase
VSAHRHRRLALGLGCALAAALGALAWGLARPKPSDSEQQRQSVRELLETGRGEARPPTASASGPEARDLYLPEDIAATLFSVRATAQVYDPWCYHIHKSGLDVDVSWEEHPAGHWRLRTNAQSLREDEAVGEGPFDLRVLVTGDSHTDGYCDNAESFANLLESALAARSRRKVDVLNAGNGAWSFYNYLGALEKFLPLRPAVFVVCFYAGNDFLEVLPPHAWFTGTALPAEDEAEVERRKLANQISPPASVQAVSSMTWFADHPELQETSVAAALELLVRAQAICERSGLELIVAGLPDPFQVDREAHAELFARLERELGLASSVGPEDPSTPRVPLSIHAQLTRALLARLDARGVRTLDLAAAFAPGGGPYFWSRDLHLSVKGHAAVAKALEPLLAQRRELAP